MQKPLLFLSSAFLRNRFLNKICINYVKAVAFQSVWVINALNAANYSTGNENSSNSFSSEQNASINRQRKEKSKVINAPEFFSRSAATKTKIAAPISKSSEGENKMESLKKTDNKIIWVDCEMTGLDIEKDKLMEVACVVTDGDLKEIARHPSIIINVSEDVLNGMDEWCTKHHGESGLTYSCKSSNVTLAIADEMLLNFVQKYTFPGVCPLGGNSNYMDRMFMQRQMPRFHKHLHYRNIDVSTIKELVMRWFPEEYNKTPKKMFAHRVVSDIEESIAELKYYRSTVFRKDRGESTDIGNDNASVSITE